MKTFLEWYNILYDKISGIVWYFVKNPGVFRSKMFSPEWWKYKYGSVLSQFGSLEE